ncbi:TetR/AcrR family transcriptional regulator [Kitasatospora sp. NBC_01287]|uniref:TetR/AcrR family transcriptional regulator n=1 Tax=Kitasatospora sp. NBC_01287 TaxID=2903573 RepID=UPI00225174F6|nr:TetR/AcrR family transcriptional regulator [Kitasatospora sp. NBC_01287]MCX4750796.1 TetR/AcrR family transcriptional regulator [Kitasatospora sp. NBC_01287]
MTETDPSAAPAQPAALPAEPPAESPAARPLPAGVLREPQQQRSREKVARILAATARLLEERDYEEVGTKLIAAEAGVSIGVLYRFFPDKEAIVTTLTARWLDEFDALGRRVLSGPLPDTPGELAARLLDAHARFRREQPGFHRLWFAGPPPPALRAYGDANDRRLAAAVHSTLVSRYGYPDTPAFALRAELAVLSAAHLLNTAFQDRPEGDPAVLAEIQLMLDRWLFERPTAAG